MDLGEECTVYRYTLLARVVLKPGGRVSYLDRPRSKGHPSKGGTWQRTMAQHLGFRMCSALRRIYEDSEALNPKP